MFLEIRDSMKHIPDSDEFEFPQNNWVMDEACVKTWGILKGLFFESCILWINNINQIYTNIENI